MRPLWQAITDEARQPHWYDEDGVEDSIAGRFDMVAAVTAFAIIRMGNSPKLTAQSALVTELFIEDMDGQLREFGVGDMVVGKHIGRLMSTLGGRIGALREAVGADPQKMERYIERNVTTVEGADTLQLAGNLVKLAHRFAAQDDTNLLAGNLGRGGKQ